MLQLLLLLKTLLLLLLLLMVSLHHVYLVLLISIFFIFIHVNIKLVGDVYGTIEAVLLPLIFRIAPAPLIRPLLSRALSLLCLDLLLLLLLLRAFFASLLLPSLINQLRLVVLLLQVALSLVVHLGLCVAFLFRFLLGVLVAVKHAGYLLD